MATRRSITGSMPSYTVPIAPLPRVALTSYFPSRPRLGPCRSQSGEAPLRAIETGGGAERPPALSDQREGRPVERMCDGCGRQGSFRRRPAPRAVRRAAPRPAPPESPAFSRRIANPPPPAPPTGRLPTSAVTIIARAPGIEERACQAGQALAAVAVARAARITRRQDDHVGVEVPDPSPVVAGQQRTGCIRGAPAWGGGHDRRFGLAMQVGRKQGVGREVQHPEGLQVGLLRHGRW